MNCRDSESLILAERDGALSPAESAALSDHGAACASCRDFRARVTTALSAYRTGIDAVPVPEIDAAWHNLRERIHAPARPAKRRPLAPVLWFAAPLAAAAALSFSFYLDREANRKANAEAIAAEVARAEWVEAGDANASTLVYVDKDSGWLVVWATDVSDTTTRG